MKTRAEFKCGTGKCLDVAHCRRPDICQLRKSLIAMSPDSKRCPECKHAKRLHLKDGRCTVLGCGHDPAHVGAYIRETS